jgi:ATP-dependent DNA helicase RecG
LNIADLGLGTVPASSRNPVLLKILEDTPLEPGRTVCENRGTGIARVRAALTDAGMEPPTFEDSIAAFSVTIPNHALLDEETRDWLATLNVVGLTGAQLTALALARRGETLTNVSYRGATGVSDSRTATAHLQALRVRGLLVQEGDRGRAVYRLDPKAGRGDTNDATRRRTHREIVLASLTAVPSSRREIAARAGLTEPQVRHALARLRQTGQAQLVGPARSKNALWRLAEDISML